MQNFIILVVMDTPRFSRSWTAGETVILPSKLLHI